MTDDKKTAALPSDHAGLGVVERLAEIAYRDSATAVTVRTEDLRFLLALAALGRVQPVAEEAAQPAAEGWMCDGCGRLTKDHKRDFQDLRLLGRISCCPERKMLPVKVFSASPAASQDGGTDQ